MRAPVRRSLAAASLVVLVPALGACGFNYQTDKVYQPAVGVNNRDGQVDVLNAVVVSGIEKQGTMVATLSNESETKSATLTDVTADSSQGVTAKLLAPIEIPPGDFVDLAQVGAVYLSGDKVTAGAFVRLTLSFDNGQKAEVNAPVVAQRDQWSDIQPANPSSTPTATPSP